MAIGFWSNIASLRATRSLSDASRGVSAASLRLSTGLRINAASDDAAGLSIVSTLRSNSRVYTQGIRNINDSVSAINISDGALDNLTGVVTRVQELATQSSNGTFSSTQRKSIDKEVDQLTREFNRIVDTTSFNGLYLLRGDLSAVIAQLGYGVDGTISFSAGSGLARTVGSGSFANPFATGGNANIQGSTLDFNSDGKLDVVAVNSGLAGVQLLRGNGDGTFSASTLSSQSGGNSQGVAATDFDGDGIKDIAMLLTNGRVELFKGDGQGNFTYQNFIATGVSGAATLTVGDFNGDGKSDLATAGLFSNSTIQVLLNTGGGFALGQTIDNGATVAAITSGDFNGDGISDIAASTNASANINIQIANSSGAFSLWKTVSASSTSGPLSAGDLDGDGVDELVGGRGDIFGKSGVGQFGLLQRLSGVGQAVPLF